MKKHLILCPLKMETDHLLKALKTLGHKPQEFHTGKLKGYEFSNLVLATGGHGKVQYAVQAQHFLNRESFRSLICVGAGGALDSSLKIGDIVLGDVTIEHDYQEKFRPNVLTPR